MKKWKLRQMQQCILIAAILDILLADLGVFLEWTWLSVVGLVLLAVTGACDVIFDRCPHCDAYLHLMPTRDFCSKCGKNVNE